MAKHFLNHYTPICDKILVYDNMSTDNTVKLLKTDPKVEVIQFDTNNRFDDFKHSEIKNNCWKQYRNEYDWVICIDFDEFLYHPNLKNILENFKNTNVTIPSILGFNMKSFKFPSDYNNPIIQQVKYGRFDNFFSKNIIFNPKKNRRNKLWPPLHTIVFPLVK